MSQALANPMPQALPRKPAKSVIAAALVAIAAIGLTSNHIILTAILATLLIASQVMNWRLPENRSISQGVRVAVYMLIIIVVGWPTTEIRMWYTKPEYTKLIGCLLSAEVVIRCFEAKASRQTVLLVFSTLIMGTAGNTYDRSYIPLLMPMFAGAAIVALRSFMPLDPSRSRGRPIGRIAIGLATIFLAAGTVTFLSRYARRLELLTMDFFRVQATPASDIGLNDAPALGPTFNPNPSMDRIALIDGRPNERYLRVLAFDTFNANRWGPPLRGRVMQQVAAARVAGSEAERSKSESLHVRLLGDTFSVLPLPLNTAGVDGNFELAQDEYGSLQVSSEASEIAYDAFVADAQDYAGPVNLMLKPDSPQLAKALMLPATLNARIVELAKRVAGEGEATIRAIRIAQYLQTTHGYSLQFHPQGDALEDFILNNRAAHCEYFASAMVIMARAVGIPARMVTGYYAHERVNDHRMVIRDHDAHAWAECWVEGKGWTTVDATAPGGKPDDRFGPPSKWRRMLETIEDVPSAIRDFLSSLSRGLVFGLIFGATAFILISGILQIRRKKRTGTDIPYAPAKDPELIAVAKRFEKWLRSHVDQQQYSTHQTWREHVRRLKSPGRCVEFINAYDESRFGGANGSSVTRLKELLEQIEQSSASTEK